MSASTSKPILIGEGTYGCVFRPAIKCDGAPNTGIDQKVSKVMKNKHANSEYTEYDRIAAADPKHKYYLGKPQKCKILEADYVAHVQPSGCRILEPNTTSADYSMLQYKDGGMDLNDFASFNLNKFLGSHSPASQKRVDLFWLHAHSLFMGLKLFAENDILHDDIKPHNIVVRYDPVSETVKFNYIDFGLMKSMSKQMRDIINLATTRMFHWSRPMEQGYMSNSAHFDQLYSYTGATNLVDVHTQMISDVITKRKTANRFDIDPVSFLLTFEYMENHLSPNNTATIQAHVRSSIESTMNYKLVPHIFVEKSIKTTDSNSLGFTLNYVANKMHTKRALTDDEYLRLHQLFARMFDPNLMTRLDNINTMIAEYESVLLQNGVLSRLKKTFRNHVITKVSGPRPTVKSIPVLSVAQASAAAASVPVPVPVLAPTQAPKPCPPGKARNPKTGRCRKQLKPCPPGKVRNPATRRCKKI